MKTAVTVLQEMMIKMGLTPEYECLSQTGPQHQAMFDYRCVACGVVVKASARSKKEAKQEVARLMLQQLSRHGHPVPPPYAAPNSSHTDPLMGPCAPVDARSYVALLKELCEEYRLASVDYELVGDTGPPHLRHFTVRARIGQHERVATSTTKKAARQLAAEELYTYLRGNLSRVTRDFNEEDALVRAHEKAMERYMETSDDAPRRPDLGQKVSEYHFGITANLDAETRAAAMAALECGRSQSPTSALASVAEVLRLRVEPVHLPPLHLLSVTNCSPELTFAGFDPERPVSDALGYITRAFEHDAELRESATAASTATANTSASATDSATNSVSASN